MLWCGLLSCCWQLGVPPDTFFCWKVFICIQASLPGEKTPTPPTLPPPPLPHALASPTNSPPPELAVMARFPEPSVGLRASHPLCPFMAGSKNMISFCFRIPGHGLYFLVCPAVSLNVGGFCQGLITRTRTLLNPDMPENPGRSYAEHASSLCTGRRGQVMRIQKPHFEIQVKQ